MPVRENEDGPGHSQPVLVSEISTGRYNSDTRGILCMYVQRRLINSGIAGHL